MHKKFLRGLMNEQGDTLIEVTVALGIMASVIVSSTAIASHAFLLGNSGKQRTQLVNAAIEQAEALRSYRDNSPNWALFVNGIRSVDHTTACRSRSIIGDRCFAMRIVAGRWQPTTGTVNNVSESIADLPGQGVVEIRNATIVSNPTTYQCVMKLEIHYGAPSLTSTVFQEGTISEVLTNSAYTLGHYTRDCTQ